MKLTPNDFEKASQHQKVYFIPALTAGQFVEVDPQIDPKHLACTRRNIRS
jgi:hypothetical protein